MSVLKRTLGSPGMLNWRGKSLEGRKERRKGGEREGGILQHVLLLHGFSRNFYSVK